MVTGFGCWVGEDSPELPGDVGIDGFNDALGGEHSAGGLRPGEIESSLSRASHIRHDIVGVLER